MIDFHSHILPDIDDGAKDVEMAAEMLKLSKEQGVDIIVATPHFLIGKGTIEEFLLKREVSYNRLMEYVKCKNIDIPEIILGAEVAYSEDLLSNDISRLCIVGTNVLMIELPFTYFNEWIYNDIYNISMKHDVDIMLAHIERYVGAHNDFKRIDPFFDLDVYIQVNADSFVDRKYKKIIKTLFNKKRIDVIGSDSHNLERRKSNMDKAVQYIKKKYGEDKLNKVISNGKKIINRA